LERGGTLLRQGGAGGCEKKQDDTISIMLGIILEPNAKKLKKADINLTPVKGIFQWATYKLRLQKL
jgi:hypothetical protein